MRIRLLLLSNEVIAESKNMLLSDCLRQSYLRNCSRRGDHGAELNRVPTLHHSEVINRRERIGDYVPHPVWIAKVCMD